MLSMHIVGGIQPQRRAGIGAYLMCLFIGFVQQRLRRLPHVLDESKFTTFAKHGRFWEDYFQPLFIPPTSPHALTSSSSRYLCQTSVLCPRPCPSLFTSRNTTHNLHLLHNCMTRFWRLNNATLASIEARIATLPVCAHYVTALVRGGDKLSLEPQYKQPSVAYIASAVLAKNASCVHLITDSYKQYQSLRRMLPEAVVLFSTAAPGKEGFFLRDVERWRPDQVRAEVLETLVNYELGRRADAMVMVSTSHIASWLALLRLSDNSSVAFIDLPGRDAAFPYLRGLPGRW